LARKCIRVAADWIIALGVGPVACHRPPSAATRTHRALWTLSVQSPVRCKVNPMWLIHSTVRSDDLKAVVPFLKFRQAE
jgi:hypothetical protein